MKKCTKCFLEKADLEFDFVKNCNRISNECKDCRRKRHNNHRRLHPLKYVYKSGGYKYVKARREKAKVKYGISAGMFSRYGLKLWLQVMDKYNKKCSMCGSYKDLTFHHINGLGRHYQERTKNKMDNRLENIQLLCRKCHGSIDGKKSSIGKVKNNI